MLPPTASFIKLFDYFNLEQFLTHNKGNIDLVLSYDVSLNNMELLDLNVSDHKAVIFHTRLLYFLPVGHLPVSTLCLLILSQLAVSEKSS